MTSLALYSNKGGVGKTAAAVNLAFLAAEAGLTTLICDLDPQGSTSFYFRVKPKLKAKARGFEKGQKHINRSIKGTDYANLDLLPADFTHRNLDLAFAGMSDRKDRLRAVFEPFEKDYDLVVLDCPPTINLVAENIFNAAEYLLVPLIPTTLSLRTHGQLLAFLAESKYRPDRVYTFFSMVDGRKTMHREMTDLATKQFDHVLEKAIPYLAAVEQMGIHRQPLPANAPRSRATAAYRALWDEIQKTILQI